MTLTRVLSVQLCSVVYTVFYKFKLLFNKFSSFEIRLNKEFTCIYIPLKAWYLILCFSSCNLDNICHINTENAHSSNEDEDVCKLLKDTQDLYSTNKSLGCSLNDVDFNRSCLYYLF